MYALARKILFLYPPEKAHRIAMGLLAWGSRFPLIGRIIRSAYKARTPQHSQKIWGLTFPNPVGLAAGFDKDARYVDALENLGFGFVEIGTVTPLPQQGNPAPRLFRLTQDKALINRMGFNNQGSLAAAHRLRLRNSRILIGGNIGKNKQTPNEEAVGDYLRCLEDLYEVVDYFVVNLSSPNTPGLRDLQEKEPLTRILQAVMERNRSLGSPKPVLVKIAPDLSFSQVDDVLEVIQATGVDGLIATNTTIDRRELLTPEETLQSIGAGGLSGRPLKARSTEMVRYISKATQGKLPIMAAGGIFNAKDAQEKLDAGASLVQVYTGFIYEGPGIVRDICRGVSLPPSQKPSRSI